MQVVTKNKILSGVGLSIDHNLDATIAVHIANSDGVSTLLNREFRGTHDIRLRGTLGIWALGTLNDDVRSRRPISTSFK